MACQCFDHRTCPSCQLSVADMATSSASCWDIKVRWVRYNIHRHGPLIHRSDQDRKGVPYTSQFVPRKARFRCTPFTLESSCVMSPNAISPRWSLKPGFPSRLHFRPARQISAGMLLLQPVRVTLSSAVERNSSACSQSHVEPRT